MEDYFLKNQDPVSVEHGGKNLWRKHAEVRRNAL